MRTHSPIEDATTMGPNVQSNSYLATIVAALAPLVVSAAASHFLTFSCCDGLSFVPAPFLGYLRWDISYAIYLGLGVFLTLVAVLITFSCKCLKRNWSLPLLVVIYAVLIQQGSTKWGLEAGKYMSTVIWGYDPEMVFPRDLEWVTPEMEAQFLKDGLKDHVRTSIEAFLTPQECQEYVDYSIQHADAWMNSHPAIPPTLYAAFGGDINYGRQEIVQEFEPYQPWHDFAPWLSDYLPHWNYYYGLERYMGRESAASGANQTHVKYVQELYTTGLRPYLEKIRHGLARHMDTTPGQIVLGGDAGTVLDDFSPPSVIVGLPNYVRQWDNNFHFDTIPWGTQIIMSKLAQQGHERPCAGGSHVHAGTLALEIPKDGAGMLWWLDDKENPGYGFQFYTPYKLGYMATVPGTVLHSIAPYEYEGWFDTKRITLQMFMLQCVDEDNVSTWYVFH